MEAKSKKQALIYANKYKLSCRRFSDECERYGIEISPEETASFNEGMKMFRSLSKKASEELRFEPSEIGAAFDHVMRRLNLRSEDIVTVFVGDCLLLNVENIFPVCLKIPLGKALEYFSRKTGDTIGAEILVASEHSAVSLLDEFDEWDDEKIFVTIIL